jgi:hypothetical protein
LTSLRNKDVRRLDVAMHNPAGVSRIERIRDLNSQLKQLRNLQRTPLDHMLEGAPLQILHGDKSLPVLLPDVVDGADVRMVESRSSLRLALKTAEGLSVFGNVVRQELEGNKAVQANVLGLIDNPHATAAHLFDHAVVRYGLSDHLLAINAEGSRCARLS